MIFLKILLRHPPLRVNLNALHGLRCTDENHNKRKPTTTLEAC